MSDEHDPKLAGECGPRCRDDREIGENAPTVPGKPGRATVDEENEPTRVGGVSNELLDELKRANAENWPIEPTASASRPPPEGLAAALAHPALPSQAPAHAPAPGVLSAAQASIKQTPVWALVAIGVSLLVALGSVLTMLMRR